LNRKRERRIHMGSPVSTYFWIIAGSSEAKVTLVRSKKSRSNTSVSEREAQISVKEAK